MTGSWQLSLRGASRKVKQTWSRNTVDDNSSLKSQASVEGGIRSSNATGGQNAPTNSSPKRPRSGSRDDEQVSHVANPEDSFGSNSVKVYVRVRPINDKELAEGDAEPCLTYRGSKAITCVVPGKTEQMEWMFDTVFDHTYTQEKINEAVGVGVVENCMCGYNSSIFAYGQTGAGKTYTMVGDLGAEAQSRGLAPRVFEYLFHRIYEEEDSEGKAVSYTCKCSFLEIYNETITDLLSPSRTNLQIREDIKRGCYVEELTEKVVQNAGDAMQLLRDGANNRRVGETKMNRESSRSHSVFTCVVERRTIETGGVTHVRFSRLNLVDLAGSERTHKSGALGKHLEEACNINASLTTLGRVISAVIDSQSKRKKTHIPYRDSRLTFLLQDSLGGNAKTVMIANVTPSNVYAHETLSTLQFAARAKFVRNRAVVNEDASGDAAMLHKEILRLEAELEQLRQGVADPAIQENARLRQELLQERETKAELERRIEQLQGDNKQLLLQNQQLDERVASQQEQRSTFHEQLRELLERHMPYPEPNIRASLQLGRLHEMQDKAALEAAEQLLQQLEAVQEAQQAADAQVQEMQAQAEEQQGSWEAQLAEAAAQREAERGEAEALRSKAEAEAAQAKDELAAAAAEAKQLAERNRQLGSELEDSAEQKGQLQKEHMALQQELRVKIHQLEDLQRELARVHGERDAASADLEGSSRERAELERRLAQESARREEWRVLAEERSLHLQEMRKVSGQVKDSSDARAARDGEEISRLRQEVSSLQSKLAEYTHALQEEMIRGARHTHLIDEVSRLIEWGRTPAPVTGRRSGGNVNLGSSISSHSSRSARASGAANRAGPLSPANNQSNTAPLPPSLDALRKSIAPAQGMVPSADLLSPSQLRKSVADHPRFMAAVQDSDASLAAHGPLPSKSPKLAATGAPPAWPGQPEDEADENRDVTTLTLPAHVRSMKGRLASSELHRSQEDADTPNY